MHDREGDLWNGRIRRSSLLHSPDIVEANQYIDKYLRDSDPLTIIDTVIGESIRPLAEPSTYSTIKKHSLAG